MNAKENKIVKDLYTTIRQADKKGTQGYDTPAEVTRIDGDTAWVHIAGGVEETPVKKTIDARKGDTVQVRVSGGNAWITGNATAPPTDDYTAKIANQTARKAQLRADSASDIANKAQASANGKNTIYYDATQPIATEGGFKVGDTWFNSAEDNAIYRYNGTAWVKEELGEDAIAELSIKTAHIQDGAITNAKVGNLDAGKITSGTINTNLLDVSGIISVGSIATDSEVSTAKSEAISTASADATTKANNAKLYADNYLTTISGTTGISVHSANDTSNYVNISSSAVNVVVGGTNVSSFGSTARVGIIGNAKSRFITQADGMEFIYRNSSGTDYTLAKIGNSGSSVHPYYTFGNRASGSTLGSGSFTVGENNTASNSGSVAMGIENTVTHSIAFAFGQNLTTGAMWQTVIGKYNASKSNMAFIIGNGTGETTRSNAFAIDRDGYLYRGDTQVPIVVETGTSGGWQYAKWSDGRVELWGWFSQSATAYATNSFVIGSASVTAYPFTISSPKTVVTGQRIGTGGCVVDYDYGRTDYWSGIAHGTVSSWAQGSTQTITWTCYVNARWK